MWGPMRSSLSAATAIHSGCEAFDPAQHRDELRRRRRRGTPTAQKGGRLLAEETPHVRFGGGVVEVDPVQRERLRRHCSQTVDGVRRGTPAAEPTRVRGDRPAELCDIASRARSQSRLGSRPADVGLLADEREASGEGDQHTAEADRMWGVHPEQPAEEPDHDSEEGAADEASQHPAAAHRDCPGLLAPGLLAAGSPCHDARSDVSASRAAWTSPAVTGPFPNRTR